MGQKLDKAPRGAYDAIVYIDGSEVVADDSNGRKIASGTAGVDDSTVINAALVHMGPNAVLFLDGYGFRISRSIMVTNTGVTIYGHGMSSHTNAVLVATSDITVIQLAYGGNPFCIIRDLAIAGYSKSTSASIGIAGSDIGDSDLNIQRVYVANCYYGIKLENRLANVMIDHSWIENNSYGILIDPNYNAVALHINDCTLGPNDHNALRLLRCATLSENYGLEGIVSGCLISSYSDDAIFCEYCRHLVFSGNLFSNTGSSIPATYYAVNLHTSCYHFTITGNCVNGYKIGAAVTKGFVNFGSLCDYINVTGNVIEGLTSSAFSFDSALSPNCVIKNNIGATEYETKTKIRETIANILNICKNSKVLVSGMSSIFDLLLSGTAMTDHSGLGNGMTASPTLSDWANGAPSFDHELPYMNFDGVLNYLSCPDDSDMTFGNGTIDTSFSFVCAFKPRVLSAINHTLVSKCNYVSSSRRYTGEYYISVISGKPTLTLIDRSVSGRIVRTTASSVMTSAKWHVLCFTYGGGGLATMKIYVNGVRVDDTSNTIGGTYVAMEDSTDKLVIGAFSVDGVMDHFADGQIALPVLTGKELSASDVWNLTEIYAASLQSPDIPIRSYPAEKSSGSSTGTGSEQTIAHGLAAIPTGCKAWIKYLVGTRYITEMIPFDATNIYPTATSGLAYEWRIE